MPGSPTPEARFTDRASLYAASRPGYPDAALAPLFDALPPAGELDIADIGAGTGISSRWLAAAARRVYAIEPNEAMRNAAEPHERVSWISGTGERTALPDASVDVVVCAQAFHWLRAEEAMREFARILRPRGRVALIWNVQSATDPATSEYREIVRTHAVDPPTSPWAGGGSHAIALQDQFDNVRLLTIPNAQRLGLDGLIARARSASYAPKSGPMLDALLRELEALFGRFEQDGVIIIRYDTELHLAENPCVF